MNIALIGFGKMGKAIEKLALEKGHRVTLRITSTNSSQLTPQAIAGSDVAIEFSRPEAAFQNISFCLKNKIPVVSGTTGWHHRMAGVKALCARHKGAFFYAPNFSIGVNIFFAINRYLASLMKQQGAYEVSIEETHHTQKKDYPGGTAITLAEDIIKISDTKKEWRAILANDLSGRVSPQKNALTICSKREGDVVGTHLVKWSSAIDRLEIKHTAHSREGFATGALMAAEWISGRQGCFGMEDLLGF
ncbi:MAG TPA: 4-hydroxy-tetrahydrodipicolinate reductase [Bacteroidetes bacterium]|nr:4-hydroxy-tetrahydrodipicolinate reductase [Bacteroidota bacterium]